MFNRILVPLDGSALATGVLPHVVALAQALGSNLTLLRVLEGPAGDRISAVNPVKWQLDKAEAHAYLNTLAAQMDEQMDRPPHLQLLDGSAAQGIIDYTQTGEFDLVALSSHGHGGVNGWQVSSVVQKVMERARKSILLVRAHQSAPAYAEQNWGAFQYRRILVPLDGSKRAEFVLPLVTALAHYYKAELLLVHVLTKPEMMQMPLTTADSTLVEQMMERNRAHAIQYFTTLQSRLSVDWQLRVETSANVTTTLHNLVEQTATDLVVLNAHGHSCQPARPYGNVAASFLAYGTTPLLLVQDLLPHEILFSQAERMVTTVGHRSQNNHGHFVANFVNG